MTTVPCIEIPLPAFNAAQLADCDARLAAAGLPKMGEIGASVMGFVLRCALMPDPAGIEVLRQIWGLLSVSIAEGGTDA